MRKGKREARRDEKAMGGAVSSEATFHPRISQNGAGEEKWGCRFHRFYLAERLIRVSLRALVQCAALLTIINKAVIILDPAESLPADVVNFEVLCHLISPRFPLSCSFFSRDLHPVVTFLEINIHISVRI